MSNLHNIVAYSDVVGDRTYPYNKFDQNGNEILFSDSDGFNINRKGKETIMTTPNKITYSISRYNDEGQIVEFKDLPVNEIQLENEDYSFCYPRLQINKLGEIVLATGKKGRLTTGILVGKTPECKTKWPIGKKWDDWEVVGELTDYDGQVTIQIENKIKTTSEV
jgi:hypothetical protein